MVALLTRDGLARRCGMPHRLRKLLVGFRRAFLRGRTSLKDPLDHAAVLDPLAHHVELAATEHLRGQKGICQ